MVANKLGLHARATAKLVQLLSGYPLRRDARGQGPRGQRQEHHGRDAARRRPGHARVLRVDGDDEAEAAAAVLGPVRAPLRRGRLMRQVLPGHGASRGSALGRARVRLPHVLDVAEEHIEADAVEAELERLHAAIDVVRGEMRVLRERLHGALAQEVGEFLDLHALLLDDPELLQGLDDLIRTGRYSADYALRLQRDRIAAVFTDDGRCVPAQPHRRHRPGDRPHPRRAASPRRFRVARPRRRHPGHRQHRAGRTRATAGAGRDGGGHRRRQRAVAQRDPRAQPAPAAGGRRRAGAAEGQRRRRARGRRHQRRWSCSNPTPTTCAATARACATRCANAASSIACAANPRARSTASTSSCGPTPNRARTSPKRMRSAPRASACIAPSSCSCSASELPDEEEQFRAYRDVVLGMTGPHGHHPHARPRRRQGRPQRPGARRRTQPRARPARRAPVARARRAVRHAAARDRARLGLRPGARARADDQQPRGDRRGAPPAQAGAGRTARAKATKSPTSSRWAR